MFKLGDAVWHKEYKANGFVVEDDPYGESVRIMFPWAKHCKKIPYGRYRGFKYPERKWCWATPDEISNIPRFNLFDNHRNKVSVVGGNFLDNLIRAQTNFPRRKPNDGSDIILAYGIGNTRCPNNILVLNRNIVTNKFQQQQLLGPDIGLMSINNGHVQMKERWIIKPIHSIGGKGIREAKNSHINYREYYQEKFPKVREFRAHVFLWCDDPLACIQEKKIDNKDQLCWNEKQGSTFFSPYAPEHRWFKLEREDPGLSERIRDLSIRALKAIKYDFGGIDIGMDAKGNLKIFEVNSRMGFKERTARVYKRVFWDLLDLDINKYKKERWN